MLVLNKDAVEELLTMESCIALMRDAMMALSDGRTRQMPRHILPVACGLYGIMGGVSPETFGSKLISVVQSDGHPSHQGVVLLFDPATGEPSALVDATSITGIRTAAASALATDRLALKGAKSLAILGTGEQALEHARAMCAVRPIGHIAIWGRNQEKAATLAGRLSKELPVPVCAAASVREAVGDAEIICTVTAAGEPILTGADVADGAHVNVVGSSRAGPREIDDSLVCRGRFYGDSRESVLSQGAEFIHAREAGLINDDHFIGEIGDVLLDKIPGRTEASDVTIYKSLGHIVQDLEAARHVVTTAIATGAGQRVSL